MIVAAGSIVCELFDERKGRIIFGLLHEREKATAARIAHAGTVAKETP